MPTPLDRPIICPILIGRDGQLNALLRLFAAATSGRGHTALLAGEAGVGKSRLVAAAKERLTAGPARTGQRALRLLAGRCFEPDGALPFAPLVDLLRAFFAACPPGEIAAHLRAAGAPLLRLLPELVPYLPGAGDAGQSEPEAEKRRLFHALTQVFTRLAAGSPTLVVLEDLHWSDDTSLDFLLHLARRAPGERLLLLLTYRDNEVQPRLAQFLAALDRDRIATEFPLARLNVAETDAMLRAIFDLGRPVPPDFLEALFTLTEGNPFFIEEVLKSLIAAGDIFYADGRWDRKPLHELQIPRSVLVAVQRRLEGLGPDARQLLSLAAVAGRRFDFALLQALTPHDEPALVRLVKELIAAQLVVEESEDRFAFRHALTREATCADLLARERRALHRAVAEALERLDSASPDTYLADLAYHYAAVGDWRKVLAYAPRAGAQAQALYAPRAAGDQYGRAIEAARHLGLPPPLAVLRARGQAHETLGEFAPARDDYALALATARAAGDSAAEWQALLDLGWLWTGRDYDRAGEIFQEAIALGRGLDQPLALAQTLNRVGNWHANAERPAEALACHAEALAIFRQLGDRREQAATLDLLGITSIINADVFAAAEHYAAAIAILRDLGDDRGVATSLITYPMRGASYVFATVALPDLDAATCRRDGEEAIAICRRIDWRVGEALAYLYLGLALGPYGDYAQIAAQGRNGIALSTELGHQVALHGSHITLGRLHHDFLDFAQGQHHLGRALAIAEEVGLSLMARVIRGFLASLLVARGSLAEAAAVLDRAAPPSMPMLIFGQRIAWAARAELALARRQPDEALAIVDRLIASALNLHAGGQIAVIPHLWHLRSLALAALGQPEEAATLLRAAAETARRRGLRPLHWRICLTLGDMLAALGHRQEAGAAYADARATIDELAPTIPDEAARRDFARRALALFPRSAVPTPRRAARDAHDGLTERERAVAALIALGRSNRALAGELVLSERTIEKHVENILGKLGFTSRAQIATWAVEKGLTRRET